MWLLVIVFLAVPAGISSMTVLNTFATYDDCQPERDRVGFEMAESYPDDNTFRIVCDYPEKKPSQAPSPQQPEQQASLTDQQL